MKVIVDFQILETQDPKRILVSDFSQWLHLDKEKSSLEVTVPDRDPVTLPFKKGAINGLNSSNLGIGMSSEGGFLDLPDGIYKIKVLGCPDKFQKTRYYLQTDIAQSKLDKLYTMIDYDCHNVDKERRDKLMTVDYLLRTAEAASRQSKVTLAEDLFECALTKLNSYLNCDNCF